METTINREPIFTEDELQLSIESFEKKHSIKIGKDDINRLRYGYESGLLENILLQDNSTIDGKIRFTKDKTGKPKLHFNAKKVSLFIPEEIDGYRFTAKDKELLLKGETIGPIEKNGQKLLISMDKELNTITVKGLKELDIPKSFGSYTLNNKDINALANGKFMEPRLFFSEGTYFIASLRITEDKKGFEFQNMKQLPKLPEHEIEAIKLKYNHTESDQKESQLNQSPTINSSDKITQDNNFEKLLIEKDFNAMVALQNNGYTLTDKDINQIKNSELTREERVKVTAIFNEQSSKVFTNEQGEPDKIVSTQMSNRQDSEVVVSHTDRFNDLVEKGDYPAAKAMIDQKLLIPDFNDSVSKDIKKMDSESIVRIDEHLSSNKPISHENMFLIHQQRIVLDNSSISSVDKDKILSCFSRCEKSFNESIKEKIETKSNVEVVMDDKKQPLKADNKRDSEKQFQVAEKIAKSAFMDM